MTASVLLGLSLALAWAIIFIPSMSGHSGLSRRVILVSCAYLGCYLGFDVFLNHAVGMGMGRLSLYVTVPIAAAVIVLDVVWAAVNRMPSTRIPALSVLFAWATVWAPQRLYDIAPDQGVRGSEVFGLAGIHVLLIILAVLVVARVRKWRSMNPRAAPIGAWMTIVFAVLSALALGLTVPRAGDEGIELWFVLVPVALLVGIMAVVISIGSVLRAVVRVDRAQRRHDA